MSRIKTMEKDESKVTKLWLKLIWLDRKEKDSIKNNCLNSYFLTDFFNNYSICRNSRLLQFYSTLMSLALLVQGLKWFIVGLPSQPLLVSTATPSIIGH